VHEPCWVYIMASAGMRVVYIGMTNDLEKRVWEHKTGQGSVFTHQYNVTILVYFEELDGPSAAIAREKQLKGWRRDRKIKLIRSLNPAFEDLAAEWCNRRAPSC
jgi:putative endonuclease